MTRKRRRPIVVVTSAGEPPLIFLGRPAKGGPFQRGEDVVLAPAILVTLRSPKDLPKILTSPRVCKETHVIPVARIQPTVVLEPGPAAQETWGHIFAGLEHVHADSPREDAEAEAAEERVGFRIVPSTPREPA